MSDVEDDILLWKILSDMKLTHIAVEYNVLEPEAANKEKLISFYQKCCTIRGIQCGDGCPDYDDSAFTEVGLILSYFPSLNYCNCSMWDTCAPSTIVQDVINNCKELRCVSFLTCDMNNSLSLNATYNHNLQQLYINSPFANVPDDFMTLVSAHGGLVHV